MMYCHASQDAYFYDYQTHGVHLYQIVRKMRGPMVFSNSECAQMVF